jgi:hypothetical protein
MTSLKLFLVVVIISLNVSTVFADANDSVEVGPLDPVGVDMYLPDSTTRDGATTSFQEVKPKCDKNAAPGIGYDSIDKSAEIAAHANSQGDAK